MLLLPKKKKKSGYEVTGLSHLDIGCMSPIITGQQQIWLSIHSNPKYVVVAIISNKGVTKYRVTIYCSTKMQQYVLSSPKMKV